MSLVIPERTERKYEPYPEYKNSGVEWLEMIPAHWDINRLKWGVSLINDKVENSETHTMYLGLESIESWTGRVVESDFRPEQEGTSNSFRKDDVLFGKLRPYLAKAVHAHYHGMCTSELMVLRPQKYYSRYLFYYVLSSSTVNIIDSSTYGVKMPRANWQFIGGLPTPLPPLQEQQAIAKVLDRETSRIDELIAKKHMLIDLLQERRTALITRAVTKGLDADVRMKDTGVEWLGETPAHWEVRRLKHISSVKVSGVDKHTKDGEYPVFLCNYGDVYNNETISPTNEFMEATATKKEMTTFSVKEGDVIVTKDSEDWKDIAVPSYVAADLSNVICGYHLALIRPSTPMTIGRFLFWALCARSINHQFTVAATGITRFGLSTYWLDNSLFLLPPIEEQQAIADFLDKETSRIDNLVGRINQAIEKLQEYRSALITAAVTGKIDVRDHVT